MSLNNVLASSLRRSAWLAAALLFSLGLRRFLAADWIESLYSRGFFVGFRWVWDSLFGWFPFPLLWLFVVFILWHLYAMGKAIYRFWRWPATSTNKLAQCVHTDSLLSPRRAQVSNTDSLLSQGQGSLSGARPRVALRCWLIGYGLSRLFSFLAGLVLAFIWMWGFHYGRVPVEEQLAFSPYSPSLDELRQRVFSEAASLAALRQQISSDTAALTAAHFPSDWEGSIRPLLEQALQKQGYPTPGRPRGRQLYPKGLLLRWSTAGVYWPWVAEGHIDAGLHPLQKPAVLAHELAHAYGFGDEGSCSFWAFLAGLEALAPASEAAASDAAASDAAVSDAAVSACVRAQDSPTIDQPIRATKDKAAATANTYATVLAYAIRFDYWRSLAARLRQADPEGYASFRTQTLDRGILQDLNAIYANNARYPDLLPRFRDATYTAYLKAQGIEEGLLNYGRVVVLVEGYLKKTMD